MSGIVFTSLTALILVMVLASPRLPGRLRRLDMYLAAAYNEATVLFMVLTLVTVAAMMLNGDWTTVLDWVSLGLAGFIMVVLVLLTWRATLDRPVLVGALDEGLGARWRSVATPGSLVALDRGPRWGRALFVPFVWRPRRVERVANISYGPAGRFNSLDLFCRRDRPAGTPVLVYLHGGGYSSGAKGREGRELLFRLAGQGWVTITANYRLRPRADFFDQLADAKQVLGWVHEHVADYGGDPSLLVASGGSAGAHLSTIAALSQNDPALQPGLESADTSVAAVIGFYGWYDGYYEMGSVDSPVGPLGYSSADAPPFLVIHGRQDPVATVGDARRLVAHLRAGSSQPVAYAELPHAHHCFDLFRTVRSQAVVDAVEAFGGWLRQGTEPPAGGH